MSGILDQDTRTETTWLFLKTDTVSKAFRDRTCELAAVLLEEKHVAERAEGRLMGDMVPP